MRSNRNNSQYQCKYGGQQQDQKSTPGFFPHNVSACTLDKIHRYFPQLFFSKMAFGVVCRSRALDIHMDAISKHRFIAMICKVVTIWI